VTPPQQPFDWPRGARAAVSLSFDDARVSQVDHALPVLEDHRLPATFYAMADAVEARLADWRRALAAGHEIGNHTLSHPCSGNYPWARASALEEFTEERMQRELSGANQRLHHLLGVTPKTFAYPCGQTFIGRGEATRSYVPLVARQFLAGRGYRDTVCNDPAYCDLAQTAAVDGDCMPFDALCGWVDQAVECGGWLVLVMHDVKPEPGRQTMVRRDLERLCEHLQSRQSELWTATVAAVASLIVSSRGIAP
jgi:peptidoglycan/xylan/chitin deacetylase (PgdA/CDA1 family)